MPYIDDEEYMKYLRYRNDRKYKITRIIHVSGYWLSLFGMLFSALLVAHTLTLRDENQYLRDQVLRKEDPQQDSSQPNR
jgi:hypothetical protein